MQLPVPASLVQPAMAGTSMQLQGIFLDSRPINNVGGTGLGLWTTNGVCMKPGQ